MVPCQNGKCERLASVTVLDRLLTTDWMSCWHAQVALISHSHPLLQSLQCSHCLLRLEGLLWLAGPAMAALLGWVLC